MQVSIGTRVSEVKPVENVDGDKTEGHPEEELDVDQVCVYLMKHE